MADGLDGLEARAATIETQGKVALEEAGRQHRVDLESAETQRQRDVTAASERWKDEVKAAQDGWAREATEAEEVRKALARQIEDCETLREAQASLRGRNRGLSQHVEQLEKEVTVARRALRLLQSAATSASLSAAAVFSPVSKKMQHRETMPSTPTGHSNNADSIQANESQRQRASFGSMRVDPNPEAASELERYLTPEPSPGATEIALNVKPSHPPRHGTTDSMNGSGSSNVSPTNRSATGSPFFPRPKALQLDDVDAARLNARFSIGLSSADLSSIYSPRLHGKHAAQSKSPKSVGEDQVPLALSVAAHAGASTHLPRPRAGPKVFPEGRSVPVASSGALEDEIESLRDMIESFMVETGK